MSFLIDLYNGLYNLNNKTEMLIVCYVQTTLLFIYRHFYSLNKAICRLYMQMYTDFKAVV